LVIEVLGDAITTGMSNGIIELSTTVAWIITILSPLTGNGDLAQ